jgi:hypothetical protein
MIAGLGRTVVIDLLSGDSSRDFTGDTFVLMRTFGFALRASLALASTHFAQLGCAH